MRADVYLVEKGIAPSRNRAQELIARGLVFLIQGECKKLVTKASLQVANGETVEIASEQGSSNFVSRGGVKLKGALEKCSLDVRGKKVLDIGISTGGFTDCLLQAGVQSVVGIDVGHAQLAKNLANEARLTLIEGVNARDLSDVNLIEVNGGGKFDLVVIDVSFISLTLVLPEATKYIKESGTLLALVKPQFEVGPKGLGKNGIVKDDSLYSGVEEKIRTCISDCGFILEAYFESSIEGSDGNREFFVLARPAQLALENKINL